MTLQPRYSQRTAGTHSLTRVLESLWAEDKLHSQHDRVRGLGTNLSPVLLGTNNLLGPSPSQIPAKKQN